MCVLDATLMNSLANITAVARSLYSLVIHVGDREDLFQNNRIADSELQTFVRLSDSRQILKIFEVQRLVDKPTDQ